MFSASIALLAGISIGWLLWMARQIGESPLRWLDTVIALVTGGIVRREKAESCI